MSFLPAVSGFVKLESLAFAVYHDECHAPVAFCGIPEQFDIASLEIGFFNLVRKMPRTESDAKLLPSDRNGNRLRMSVSFTPRIVKLRWASEMICFSKIASVHGLPEMSHRR